MSTTEIPSPSTAARPTVNVSGGDDLAARVAALGWTVVRVDSAGAESARRRGLAVVSEESSGWGDDKLAAAVAGKVADYTQSQLDALRAEARKASHDARNAIGLLWMHLAALERSIAKGDAAEEIKVIVEQVKEETRVIVGQLDVLSAAARR